VQESINHIKSSFGTLSFSTYSLFNSTQRTIINIAIDCITRRGQLLFSNAGKGAGWRARKRLIASPTHSTTSQNR